jgi:2-hydroxychromene-2-carboxylate isomerase
MVACGTGETMSDASDGPSIDFWVSVGSTYTVLTVRRLEEVARRAQVRFRWRPFNVRVIMAEQRNFPFANKPVKEAYMWRDLRRRGVLYGLDLPVPVPYPCPDLERANRVAIVAQQEGWCPAYVAAAYGRWFDHKEPIGSPANLDHALGAVGQDPARVLELAQGPAAGQALEAATDEARSQQIFGSPTFVVAGEVFWGDDRLEDAIRWARDPAFRARTDA